MKKSILIFLFVVGLIFLLIFLNKKEEVVPIPTISPTPFLFLQVPGQSKILPNNYQVFQTFNNCGPAALSMALSYYGISKTQQELGNDLRPFQNQAGDNDDKSVTLEELAEKSKEFGLIPFHRPNGNMELITYFITYDMPVVTRTLLKPNEDIGHYRVVKGYDDLTNQIIQDDSLQGASLRYSYDEFTDLWKQFNYEYLVLVPQDKVRIVEAILGEESNEKKAWERAVESSQKQLALHPDDISLRFNLSVSLYNAGRLQESVLEFEKIENQLPFRTLWYQIEPIQAYFELGNDQRVFEITDRILNNYNRAFSELYILRGEIYKRQGNIEAARQEFKKAAFYNNKISLPSLH